MEFHGVSFLCCSFCTVNFMFFSLKGENNSMGQNSNNCFSLIVFLLICFTALPNKVYQNNRIQVKKFHRDMMMLKMMKNMILFLMTMIWILQKSIMPYRTTKHLHHHKWIKLKTIKWKTTVPQRTNNCPHAKGAVFIMLKNSSLVLYWSIDLIGRLYTGGCVICQDELGQTFIVRWVIILCLSQKDGHKKLYPLLFCSFIAIIY